MAYNAGNDLTLEHLIYGNNGPCRFRKTSKTFFRNTTNNS